MHITDYLVCIGTSIINIICQIYLPVCKKDEKVFYKQKLYIQWERQ